MEEPISNDDITRENNLHPGVLRSVIKCLEEKLIPELKEKGQAEIPGLGKIILDYIGKEPIFYFEVDSRLYDFEPEPEIKKIFRKIY